MTPYKKIVTYAGEPVQEYGQLLKSIGEDFDRKKAAHQTFDFLRKSVDVAENDKAIINPILDGFDNTIKDFAKDVKGNIRYDLLQNKVTDLATDFATNKHLKAALENAPLIAEDIRRSNEAGFNENFYGGVDKNFRSVNPDGSTNKYASKIEKKLDADKGVMEVLNSVGEEMINELGINLSPEEKAAVGQGGYKFITTIKKDSSTYNKLLPEILKRARNIPELQQYAKYNGGEKGLEDYITTIGKVISKTKQAVDFQQGKTVTAGSTAQGIKDADYSSSWQIVQSGKVKTAVNGEDKLPEDAESYDSGTKKEFISYDKTANGAQVSTTKYNKKVDDKITNIIDKIPEFKDLTKAQAVKKYNANIDFFEEELNTKYGGTDLLIQSSKAIESGSALDRIGNTIKATDTDVVLVNGDRRDKKALGEKLKDFNFQGTVKSTFLGVNTSFEGDNIANGGYKFLIEDDKGNKQEVIKYDDTFNKQLEPASKVIKNMYSLIKNSSKEHLENNTTLSEYSSVPYEGLGTLKIRSLNGNLTKYKGGKNSIPNIGTGIDTRIEIIFPNQKNGKENDIVTYMTVKEFKELISKGLVESPSFKQNFK